MYRRGDLGQVARALRVLDELRGFRGGRRISAIAEALGVSEKTIGRDLAELEDAGFEIERIRIEGRAAARLIDKSYSHVTITRSERYSLFALRAMASVLVGTQFHRDYENVLAKLEQRLSPEMREEYATFGDRFVYVPHGGTKLYAGTDDQSVGEADEEDETVDDILNEIVTSVLGRKVLRFVYADGRGRIQKGYLAPYAMLLYRHGLYVVARRLKAPEDGEKLNSSDKAGRVGLYAAERFSEAQHLRNARFRPPPSFSLRKLLGGFTIHDIGANREPQRVVVEFSKARSAYVRTRRWHRDQSLLELADGRVRIEFPCRNLAPIVSWVLEWGPHARAVEPDALVSRVVQELDDARAQYSDES